MLAYEGELTMTNNMGQVKTVPSFVCLTDGQTFSHAWLVGDYWYRYRKIQCRFLRSDARNQYEGFVRKSSAFDFDRIRITEGRGSFDDAARECPEGYQYRW